MSTGVYRQYPTQRLTAPLVTAAQALDAPISAPRILGDFDRIYDVTRLIPLGIAALIPVLAAFVPSQAVASVARTPYAMQPLARYLPTYVPSDQAPASSVVRASFRAAPAVPAIKPGIAALIPATVAMVTPYTIARLEVRTSSAPRLQAPAIAPLLPAAAAYVPASPVSSLSRSNYPPLRLKPATFTAAALNPTYVYQRARVQHPGAYVRTPAATRLVALFQPIIEIIVTPDVYTPISRRVLVGKVERVAIAPNAPRVAIASDSSRTAIASPPRRIH